MELTNENDSEDTMVDDPSDERIGVIERIDKAEALRERIENLERAVSALTGALTVIIGVDTAQYVINQLGDNDSAEDEG